MKNMFFSFKFAAILATFLTMPAVAWAQDDADREDNPPSKEQLTALYQNQNWRGSAAMAEQLLQIDPEDTDILSVYGVALAQLNRNEEAEPIFKKLLEKKPDDPGIVRNLCHTQSVLKRDTALETCIKAADLNPDVAQVQHFVGQMLQSESRTDEALARYLKAWELEKTNPIYLTAATSIEFSQKKYEQAYEHTKSALDSGLNNPVVYLNVLIAANYIGKYEETIKLADKGYEIFHDDMMLMNKAVALYKLARFEEAETLLKELDPRTPEKSINWARFQYTYGQVLLATGCDLNKASSCQTPNEDACCAREREALARINKVKDHDLLKRETLLPVYLGLAQLINGEGKSAESVLAKALDQKEGKEDILAALAVTLYQFGDEQDKKAGLKYLEQALEISKDFEDIAKIKSSRGWPDRVLENYKKMLDDRNAKLEKPKKSGCSCDIAGQNGAPLSLASIFAVLAVLLAGLGLRRKADKSQR